MSGNTFGQLFRLTTFGESHGVGLGGVIDGCPAGLALDEAVIQEDLDRRKPGQGLASTQRKESDTVQLLSGVFEGKTTGTAIGFTIMNQDQRSRDYSAIQNLHRPGHADYSYRAKYGTYDYRGGGRASGRETACRVAGGAVARALLRSLGVEAQAYPVELAGLPAQALDVDNRYARPFFAPEEGVVEAWQAAVVQAKKEGDSLGGVVQVQATGVPAGLGEPVFDKLDARLAYALMSVGAVKGVEIGSGFAAARSRGSRNNDGMQPGTVDAVVPAFASNNAGGVLGGISSGQDIVVRAAVKPIPSIAAEQKTVAVNGEATALSIGGRHDVSAIPRIVPVLEAMVLLVLADFVLLQRRMG